jgi:hypothetical protein
MALSKILPASQEQYVGARNILTNGSFAISQRGTSFTGITDQYTLDRWTSSSAGGVSLNVSQQTATSSDNAYFASKHFARYQRNAVLSGFVHKVEDLQQFNNKTFTLSFWAKSSDAGTNVNLTAYTVNDGSSFNNYVTRTYVTNPTLSSTWQKYEVRLAFQDMYTYGYSGSHHLRLQFFDGSNAATFDIAEVQLELGDTSTAFEHESFAETLQKCQRYHTRIMNASGQNINTTVSVFAGVFPTEMRTTPTGSVSGTVTMWELGIGGSKTQSSTSFNVNSSINSASSFNADCGNFSSLTANRATAVSGTTRPFIFDAEL